MRNRRELLSIFVLFIYFKQSTCYLIPLVSNNLTLDLITLNNHSRTLNISLPEVISELNLTKTTEPTDQRSFFFKTEPMTTTAYISEKPEEQMFLVEVNLQIENFLMFEPKNGVTQLSARLQYKWWNRLQQKPGSLDNTLNYQPVMSFRNDQNWDQTFKETIEVVEQNSENQARLQTPKKTNSPTIFDFKYAALEQDITLKFKCQHGNELLDTSRFPFDKYTCQQNLYLDLVPIGHRKSGHFSNYSPSQSKPRFSVVNRLDFDDQNFNKLVVQPGDNTLITRDWILKRLRMTYLNTSQGTNDYSSRIQLTLDINRRVELHVFILIVPLGFFTCLTFLVFLLPTSNTSEKTMLTFINFICLLLFNIYLFKLVMYTYKFVHVPQILQYSNCLMVMQLVVFVYICLAKSIYHYGLFNLNTDFLVKHEVTKKKQPKQHAYQNNYERSPGQRGLDCCEPNNIQESVTLHNFKDNLNEEKTEVCCTMTNQVIFNLEFSI